MTMQRWDPFGEMMSLRTMMDRLFDEAFVPSMFSRGTAQAGGWQMPLDVYEEGDNFHVRASLPGVRPEDVNISAQGNTLTISGESRDEWQGKGTPHYREHRYGRFYRSITLPTPIDSERAQANFEHGVLTLTLPKVEAARTRQIPVRGQSATIEASAQQPQVTSGASGSTNSGTAEDAAKAGNGQKATTTS